MHYWKWCCSAIRDAFIRQIKEGYSLADKQLRYVFTLEWKSVNEIVQLMSLLLSCGFKQNLSLWMKPSVWMSSHSTCINKNSKLKVRAQDTHEHRVYSYNTTKHPFRKGWRRARTIYKSRVFIIGQTKQVNNTNNSPFPNNKRGARTDQNRGCKDMQTICVSWYVYWMMQ